MGRQEGGRARGVAKKKRKYPEEKEFSSKRNERHGMQPGGKYKTFFVFGRKNIGNKFERWRKSEGK